MGVVLRGIDRWGHGAGGLLVRWLAPGAYLRPGDPGRSVRGTHGFLLGFVARFPRRGLENRRGVAGIWPGRRRGAEVAPGRVGVGTVPGLGAARRVGAADAAGTHAGAGDGLRIRAGVRGALPQAGRALVGAGAGRASSLVQGSAYRRVKCPGLVSGSAGIIVNVPTDIVFFVFLELILLVSANRM